MKITSESVMEKGKSRLSVQSTSPSAGLTNVSSSDNSPVMMNTPELKERGFRCDQLVEMAGDDGYRLSTEKPRHSKMTG